MCRFSPLRSKALPKSKLQKEAKGAKKAVKPLLKCIIQPRITYFTCNEQLR